jgi:hypothetical protein
MTKIIGEILMRDDFTHDPGTAANYNESSYFNFCDPQTGIGGFMRMGRRPNAGHAEFSAVIYLDDGRVLFRHDQAPISHNSAFEAGGVVFEILEPMERHRTTFCGSAAELDQPRRLFDGHDVLTESPVRRLEIDLLHTAIGPVFSVEHPDNGAFDHHFEQHMAVEGVLRLDGSDIAVVKGFGMRDRSWGPRHWEKIQDYSWLTMNFGSDFGMKLYVLESDSGEETRDSWIIRGSDAEPVARATIQLETDASGPFHRAIRATAESASGEQLRIEGEVLGIVPLRFETPAGLTYLGEGLTRWRCGDRVGYGMSEVLRQLT